MKGGLAADTPRKPHPGDGSSVPSASSPQRQGQLTCWCCLLTGPPSPERRALGSARPRGRVTSPGLFLPRSPRHRLSPAWQEGVQRDGGLTGSSKAALGFGLSLQGSVAFPSQMAGRAEAQTWHDLGVPVVARAGRSESVGPDDEAAWRLGVEQMSLRSRT